MSLFRRLTFASLGATFLLISIGGLVRATKSGLGCGTDWPECGGRLVPALQSRAEIIEFSHRLAASVVVALLAATAVAALRSSRSDGRLRIAALGAFGLVLFQALLGAVVVKLELQAASVMLHLATALALLGLLVYLAVATGAAEARLSGTTDRSLSNRAAVAALSLLVVLLVGSYSSSRDIGGSWPLVDGQLVPNLAVTTFAIHWLHRVLAAAVAVILFWVALQVVKRKHEMPLAAKLAHVAAGLYLIQIIVGAINVWTDQNPAAVTIHLAAAAVIWSSLVGMAALLHPAHERARAGAAAARSRPALQGSR